MLISLVRLLPVFVEHLWDANSVLDDNSNLGGLLKGVFGYNGNPSLIEVVAYVWYLATTLTYFLRTPRAEPAGARVARLPGSRAAGTPGNRRRRSLIPPGILLAGVMMILAVGCSAASDSGDRTPLPSYAYNSSDTLSAYQAAVSAPEALSAVPCYCGCGPSQGHVSLKDCYLQPDGSYTDHASNCHLCVEEALDVGKWHAQGVSLKEIRSRIDQKYGDHGPPTRTLPVS